jgi:ABC-type Mn2+/Zn2+ transport system ATPase subunit
MGSPVIIARNLSAGYGKALVLENLSLTIEEGSLTGFCGPNGAGKSTFLRLCLGLLRLRTGSLSVLGAVPGKPGFRRTLPRIGYVPQNTQGSALPLTVREAVAMGRYGKAALFRPLSNRDRTLVEEALETVGVSSLAKNQVRELSGGQAQRVAIARALVMEPELFLLDEPNSGLDQEGRQEFLRLIKSRQASGGLTAVIVSHSAETLAACGTIYRFGAGGVRRTGGYEEGSGV